MYSICPQVFRDANVRVVYRGPFGTGTVKARGFRTENLRVPRRFLQLQQTNSRSTQNESEKLWTNVQTNAQVKEAGNTVRAQHGTGYIHNGNTFLNGRL